LGRLSPENRQVDAVAFDAARMGREHFADARRKVGAVEEQGTLEVLPAVQAGAKDKMAVEKRSSLAKKEPVDHPSQYAIIPRY
jgi:hypothetical protein